MASDGSNQTGQAMLSSSAATGECGEFREPDPGLAVSMGSVATTAFSAGAKVVTVRAIRGSTVSVPFNVDRESARQDNLKANGFAVVLETTSEAYGGSR